MNVSCANSFIQTLCIAVLYFSHVSCLGVNGSGTGIERDLFLSQGRSVWAKSYNTDCLLVVFTSNLDMQMMLHYYFAQL